MECLHCKVINGKSKAPFSIDRNGYHISWDSIPALVCTQCVEILLEENEITHIQKALTKIDCETSAIGCKVA